MRVKQLRLIVTFQTTTAAMAMEKVCAERGVPGRLIPVPREITAGCGMAWSAPPDARDAVEKAAREAGIDTDGWHELMV
ncbi:MAG: DUF3343 domain-containing protein [Christensenellaceae bacterium]|nr:DUF3343 domain-containing protein [Christensenellaceae bacterium]